MKERQWKARIPPPLASTGERPVCPPPRYMAILLSFNLFPFVATSYFTPGRVTLDEILSDTAFHNSFGLLYSAIFPFRASGLRFELAPFTAGGASRISASGFLEVYPMLPPILFRRLSPRRVIQSNNCCTANGSLFYECN